MAAATNLANQVIEGPAKSELVPAWAPLARLLSNKVRPHSVEMGSGSAGKPEFVPLLLRGPFASLDHFAFEVLAIHGAGLRGELLELHLVVAIHHDFERFTHRRRTVEFFDGDLGALCGGDIGAACDVVVRHGDL